MLSKALVGLTLFHFRPEALGFSNQTSLALNVLFPLLSFLKTVNVFPKLISYLAKGRSKDPKHWDALTPSKPTVTLLTTLGQYH